MVFVDGHVHYYECYHLSRFLDSAAVNFQRGAAESGLRSDAPGCLLLAETPSEAFFQQLLDGTLVEPTGRWTFESTAENTSLIARRDRLAKLVIIAGRQINTREGLEVLALGSHQVFPPGLSLRQALEAIHSNDAIAVLPWGFGKWWFGRGRLLLGVVDTLTADTVYLGDSSARPRISPRPKLFHRAEREGIRILAGTDPLPFPMEVSKPGSYGFAINGKLDLRRPARSLKNLLRQTQTQPHFFGSRSTLRAFLRSQVGMQIRMSRVRLRAAVTERYTSEPGAKPTRG